ncbi:MAG: aminotransferase class I/II-fold pyridoxal phosphate-dependent enzyme [Planctomycetota bacterium]
MASRALAPYGTSVFTVFSALAREHDAINLAQGFPDFDGPEWIQDAARDAMRRGHNQYAASHGAVRLRRAVAADTERRYGLAYDPQDEVTVTTGATEGIAAALLGLLDPGDEVLTFEPFYDSYPACAAMAGARLRAVPLRPPGFVFDPQELERAFTPRTRLFILNTPHNPTGRVFAEEECARVVELCRRHDAWLLCDEVYERLTFAGHEHFTPARLDRERTIRLSSAAKTFSLTGWKVGWACSCREAAAALRRAHQFLVFCAAAPLQEAIAIALEEAEGRGYDDGFGAAYARRRVALLEGLEKSGFRPTPPEGTYFVMADYGALARPGEGDDAFCRRLIRERGVAALPPRSFYEHPEHGRHLVRFAFCKEVETLREAGRRLARSDRARACGEED